jgi:hypothetical protein
MTEKPLAQRIVEELLKERTEDTVKVSTVVPQPLKKEAKKEPPAVKPKFYYDIKLDAMLPATLTFRVLAETPEQAAGMIKNMSPVAVKHKLVGKKDLKLTVYLAGSSMIMWARNLIGR